MVRCTGAGEITQPLSVLPEQRSGLGGTEKQDADPPGGGLRAFGGLGGSPAAGRALRATEAVHHPVSIVVQAQKQHAGREVDQAAAPRAANTAAAAPAYRSAQRSGSPGPQGVEKAA